MSPAKYRPDIDGLRAIAIVAIVLYHAGLPFVPGGFVGVDIFFVISGFLMASILWPDMTAGQFSFRGFADSRIRRLLPAQIVVVVLTLVAGFFVYFPEDFLFASEQGLAGMLSVANFFYYVRADYFHSNPLLMPFLHLWSLSLEVQFYIVLPLVLLLIKRFAPDRASACILFLAIASFALSVWLVEVDGKAAFYMLPSRLWEFLLGSLVALHGKKISTHKAETEFAAITGLLLICLSVFSYNKSMFFPGVAALAPCLGAVLFIWANQGEKTFAGQILSRKAPVFIGLVSYSWYLWHWPMLLLYDYQALQNSSAYIRAAIVAGSFIAAVLSWRYVEKPFRAPQWKKLPRTTFFWSSGALFVVTLLLILYIAHAKRVEYILMQIGKIDGVVEKRPYSNCERVDVKMIASNDVCQTHPDTAPGFVVWGDSYAEANLPMLFNLSEKYKRNGYVLFKSDCPPLIDHKRRGHKDSELCYAVNHAALSFIKRNKIKNVIIIANWTRWFINPELVYNDLSWYDQYRDIYANVSVANAQRTIDLLQKDGVKVYFLIPTPIMNFNAPKLLEIQKRYGKSYGTPYTPLANYEAERKQDLEGFIHHNAGNKGIVFIDPLPAFCSQGKCWGMLKGQAVYRDENHLSLYGNSIMQPLFDPVFEKELP